jgi:hypothetical protein
MARKRVTMTMDEKVYADFQAAIIDYGYPRAFVGVAVQKFMKKVMKDIEKHGSSPDLEIFELDDDK